MHAMRLPYTHPYAVSGMIILGLYILHLWLIDAGWWSLAGVVYASILAGMLPGMSHFINWYDGRECCAA